MTTTTTQAPDINEMYVIHRVFRREFPMLAELVRAVPSGDTGRARMVGEHLQLLLAGLHMHHTGEDEVLWPRLTERASMSNDLVQTMIEQHERVDGYIEQIEPMTRRWQQSAAPVQGEQLARLVEDFAAALFEHLELEERAVLPLIARHISAAEWAMLGEHGRSSMTKKQLPLMFGAVLEDAEPDERAKMLGSMPLPIRVLLRTVGAAQYRRYISRVRAR